MAKKTDCEMKCDKCGKLQPKDETMKTKMGGVYKFGQTCECGGKFSMYMNGQKVW